MHKVSGASASAAKQRDLDQFLRMLSRATTAIPPEYMKLPIAGQEEPVYRERVYCYELYHRLRKEMEQTNVLTYSLCGEIDKSGHPLIRGNHLDRVKPDFLVHKPGVMNDNLVAIEVKATNAGEDGIAKDLKCLTSFRREASYFHAIYLIYGEEQNGFQQIKDIACGIAKKETVEIDIDLITLYWHRFPGTAAEILTWT